MTGAELLADAVAGTGDGAAPGARAATADDRLAGAFPASPGTGKFSRLAATLPLPAWSPGPSDGLVVDIGGTKLLIGAVRGRASSSGGARSRSASSPGRPT